MSKRDEQVTLMPTDVNTFSMVSRVTTFVKGWPEESAYFDDLPSFFPGSTHARENFDDENAPLLQDNDG